MLSLRPMRPRLLLLLCLLAAAALPASAVTISVDDDCTLSEAIVAANLDTAQGKCVAGSGTDVITLTANVTLNGVLPAITANLTIDGSNKTVSGNDAGGVFAINGADVILQNMTISGGLTGTSGGGVHVEDGALTLRQVTVDDNRALDSGGGIYANDSDVTLIGSFITNNTAGRGGGAGIYIAGNTGTHKLTASRSVLSYNSASQDGGAIHAAGGTVEIRKSGLQGNSADEGGVIEIWNGKLIMHNNTLNANSAREGGAINAGADLESTGSVELIHNTFTDNSAFERGGSIAMTGVNATLKIGNTWISGSLASGVKHCDPGVSPYTILGNTSNYIVDSSCPTQPTPTPTPEGASIQSAPRGEVVAQVEAQSLSTLKLGAIQKKDGVIYHPLLAGNVALDAADQSLCLSLNNPDDDIVDTTRPQNTRCDIGAWEMPHSSPTPTPMGLQVPTNTPTQSAATQVGPDVSGDPPDVHDPDSTATPPGGGPPLLATPTLTPTLPSFVPTSTPTPPGFVPSATPTSISGAVPPSQCAHRVVSGDSLYLIALNNNTTIDALRRLNRLQSDTLHVGQLIDLPQCRPPAPDDPYPCPGAPIGYQVQSVSPDVRCQAVEIADIDKHPLMNAGVLQALDVWGAVEAGAEICFSGAGSLVFEDDSASPAQATRLPLYSKGGLSCAIIPASGRIAHVAPLTDEQSIPLTSCRVTTSNVARLLDAPGGSNVQALLPFNLDMPAPARTANWFRVDYLGASGWVSAALVQTEGTCD